MIAAKKRGLDAAAPVNQNKARSDLQSALDTQHELLTEIDRLTDQKYKKARDLFAGPASMQTALKDGMDLWKMSFVVNMLTDVNDWHNNCQPGNAAAGRGQIFIVYF